MTLYDGQTLEEWHEELAGSEVWNKRHLFSIFSLFGTPSSMLDIGCGKGTTVEVARLMQIDAWGVDQMVDESYDPGRYFHKDLREPFSLGGEDGCPSHVDLVLCWEVAEHIPPENLNVFCHTVASHLKRNDDSLLVFTAAHPGQGGTLHQSALPHTYWRDEFYSRGLNYDENKSRNLALLWSNINSPFWWLAANVQVFSR